MNKKRNAKAIINATILCMSEEYTTYDPGFILIEDSVIKDVGGMQRWNSNSLVDKEKNLEILDASNCLIIPGLINTHTHLSMTLLRGLGDDLNLKQWLNDVIFKYEASLTEEDCYIGAYIACLESIKSGVTCINDMYFHMERVRDACLAAGVRSILSYGMIDFRNEEKRKKELETAHSILRQNASENELITYAIAPHSAYTASKELISESISLCKEYRVPMHIHIAETEDELTKIQQLYPDEKQTPVKYLDSIGIFDEIHCIAAHCVWLKEEDKEILAKKQVGISHNPSSNAKLSSGIAPIPSLLEKGAIIGLGTDGSASNNNLSILSEMRLMSFIQRIGKPSHILKAKEIVAAATREAAKVLNKGEEIGTIEIGKKADLTIFNLQDVNINRQADYYSTVVYSLKEYNILHVMINGKYVLRDGELTNLKHKNWYNLYEKACSELKARVEQTRDT